MIEAKARAIYGVLVDECGARPEAEASFVHAFTQYQGEPPREFRINGSLGFGGKFRYPATTVDCYPEDMTPARSVMIENTNRRLATLRQD